MELTTHFFKEQLKELNKINRKIAKFQSENRDIKGLMEQIHSIDLKMSGIFEDLYHSDYCLTGSDVAQMLDVTEYYLFLKLKDKLDFITPPRGAFVWVDREIDLANRELIRFQVETEREIPLSKENQKYKNELQKRLEFVRGLKRKKVFVSKSSLINFLKVHVQVELKSMQVVVGKDELNAKFSTKAINHLIEEFKKQVTHDIEPDTNSISYTTTLSDDVIEQILKGELSIYSAKSIKDRFIEVTGSTVHNTQFYRFLDTKGAYSKLLIQSVVPNLKKKDKQQSLVRYLLDIEPQAELFKSDDLIVFSIESQYYYEEIRDDFIDFVNSTIEKKRLK